MRYGVDMMFHFVGGDVHHVRASQRESDRLVLAGCGRRRVSRCLKGPRLHLQCTASRVESGCLQEGSMAKTMSWAHPVPRRASKEVRLWPLVVVTGSGAGELTTVSRQLHSAVGAAGTGGAGFECMRQGGACKLYAGLPTTFSISHMQQQLSSHL